MYVYVTVTAAAVAADQSQSQQFYFGSMVMWSSLATLITGAVLYNSTVLSQFHVPLPRKPRITAPGPYNFVPPIKFPDISRRIYTQIYRYSTEANQNLVIIILIILRINITH